MEVAEWKKIGKFLVGVADEIAHNVTRGFQNVGESFTNQLTGLSTVIGAQGISQVVGSVDGELPNLGIRLSQLRSTCY